MKSLVRTWIMVSLASSALATGERVPQATGRPAAAHVLTRPQPHGAPAAPRPTLDGNLSDLAAITELLSGASVLGAAVHAIDEVANGPAPGADGFQDEPLSGAATPPDRLMHSPTNVGDVYIVYVPDSDGIITPPTEDDSWLAIGVNIANGDGDVFDTLCKLLTPPDLPDHIMVPFDSDGDGDPCSIGLGEHSRWYPNQPSFLLAEGYDAITAYFYTCAETLGDVSGIPDFSISLYQDRESPIQLDASGLDPDRIDSFPPPGATCAEIAARGEDGVVFDDGRGNDDIEFLIHQIDSQVAAHSLESDAQAIRHRLANMVIGLTSSATGDRSHDDLVIATLRDPEPRVDASAVVREVGIPFDWDDWVDLEQAGYVDFSVSIENTGDAPLVVTLTDRLTLGSGMIAEYEEGSLLATLDRAGVGDAIPISTQNAAGFGLNPMLLTPGPLGFIHGAVTREPRYLGTLRGREYCGQTVELGDRVTIQFTMWLGSVVEYCEDDGTRARITNTISVEGVPPFGEIGAPASDATGRVDTPAERTRQFDDNVAAAVVWCHE